jgi:RNA polymerase sigma-70 factor (ECF subfamily)
VVDAPGPPDADLVAAARDGDRAAIDALVTRYQPLVYRYGLRMCGHPDAAGDVLQDTLLSLARSIPDFRGESSLSTWLYTVARRACVRRRRRRKFEPVHHESLDALPQRDLDALAAPDRNPEQALAGRETRAALEAAIASLKPADREVLVLRDIDGLSAPEVATVLGVGVAAVKSRLHRARLAVRERLEPSLSLLPGAAGPDCPDVLGLLSRHLEGDLAASTCAEMLAHVERCPRCRGACESLRRVLALCRDSPAAAPPRAVGIAVRDAIRVALDASRAASRRLEARQRPAKPHVGLGGHRAEPRVAHHRHRR